MKRLRTLVVLLSLALVASACGSDDDTTDTTVEPTGTTTEPADTTGDTAADTEASTTTEVPTEPTEAPSGEKTVVVGTTDSIANLDTADAYAVHDWEILRNVGEALTKFTPGTTDLVPGIAERWDVSADGTVYTFHLRDGVAFGDGTELTAPMYVDHMYRMLDLDGSGGVGGSLGKPYISCVVEGEPEVDDEGNEVEICEEWGVQALDDRTVEITLNGAYAYFPQVAAGSPYAPSPPGYPSDELVEVPEMPLYGVGAWIMEAYTPAEQSVFVPNPHYYGDPPKVDRIIIRYYSEASQLVAALQAGDIDVAWRSVTEPSLLETLEGAEGVTSAEVPGGGIRFFIMNHDIAPIDSHEVRQAIAAVIDRDELVDRAFGGNADLLYSPVPPGFLGATEVFDDVYQSPDPDLAVELLTEAGYSEGNPLQLEINYPPDRYGGVVEDAVQIVAEQLEDTGLVEVETVGTEWATYLGQVIGGDTYAMSFLGWFFDFPDSSNYIEPFTSFGGLGTNVTDDANNPAPGLTRPELIDLIAQAGTELDETAREELYRRVQELYAEDVVTIPLWLEPERVFYHDYISGDPSFTTPESLNIGPTTTFNWTVLDTAR